ncbi:MAG TPA: hypothetical protein VH796_09735 [Nitrososphaeraceae archaeon]
MPLGLFTRRSFDNPFTEGVAGLDVNFGLPRDLPHEDKWQSNDQMICFLGI